MKADTALVRSDCGAELNTEAAVDLNLAVVVKPGYTENDLSFRFNKAFENALFNKFGSALGNRLKRFQNLGNRLNKFGLVGILYLYSFK